MIQLNFSQQKAIWFGLALIKCLFTVTFFRSNSGPYSYSIVIYNISSHFTCSSSQRDLMLFLGSVGSNLPDAGLQPWVLGFPLASLLPSVSTCFVLSLSVLVPSSWRNRLECYICHYCFLLQLVDYHNVQLVAHHQFINLDLHVHQDLCSVILHICRYLHFTWRK